MKREMFSILALSLLLVACDRELPDNKSGKEVTIRVRLVGVAEGGEEDVTRSASMKESEIVSMPVGDGMLMEMQMEQDTSALRAQQTQLDNNSLFRVVALKRSSTTFISYADYKGDGTLVAGGLHVPINDSYDFVCYSYNTTSLPAAPTQKQGENISTTIDVLQGTKDLLWMKIAKDVGNVAPELEILLSRLMVRMKVVIDLSYNKWTITSIGNITLSSVNSGGTVLLTNGTTAGTGTPILTPWSGSSNQWESELLVMPKASGAITVSIPKEAIARQNLSAIPTKVTTSTFTSELKSGFSYRLLVRLRIPIFARSNIYWDGTAQKLTFETAADDPAQNNNTKQGYQGVFFKWGSLVGISPAGASYDNNTALYVPYDYTDATPTAAKWKQTTRNAVKSDTKIPAATDNWTTWGGNTAAATDIPYMDQYRGGTSTDLSNTWLIDAVQNNETTYQGLRGDICQYLGKTQSALADYRLPTPNEFGPNGVNAWNTSTPDANGWQKGTGSFFENISVGYADGTANLLVAANNNGNTVYGSGINRTMGDVVFPASGSRFASSGGVSKAGELGRYWSGSANGTLNGYYFLLYNLGAATQDYNVRSFAFAIRCVKND
jgi:hypothetical protein